MRFQVPQFIEVEDKIFGPLTLKQFIYLAGGGGLAFVVYVLIGNIYISAIPIIVILASVAALSFYPVNSRPLINTVEAAVKYWVGSKLFIWKKEEKSKTQAEPSPTDAKSYAHLMVPKISESKLKDLSWSLDVKK